MLFRSELRVRATDALESRLLLVEPPIGSPFFSPDGSEIGFYANTDPELLKRVSVRGGSRKTRCRTMARE